MIFEILSLQSIKDHTLFSSPLVWTARAVLDEKIKITLLFEKVLNHTQICHTILMLVM